jgi:hypothetical protein
MYNQLTFNYYYNQVPGEKPWRNNLVYTSLISEDKKVFVQHYINDSEYHQEQHKVNPKLMNLKWARELCYLNHMNLYAPDLIPKILDIDLINKKIYLEIDGVDLWQQSLDRNCTFDEIVPDWQEQMLNMLQTYKQLRFWKFSLHPNSYFVINGKLKSINYFFCYGNDEGSVSIAEHLSHISQDRQVAMKPITDSMGIEWDKPYPLSIIQQLTLESFTNIYPRDFIEKAKHVFL